MVTLMPLGSCILNKSCVAWGNCCSKLRVGPPVTVGLSGTLVAQILWLLIPGTAASAFCDAALSDFAGKRDALFPDSASHQLHLVLASSITSALSAGSPTDAADELGRRLGKAMKAAKAAAQSNHVAWAPPPPPKN
ncbi:MAG: hypothetical protein V9G23_13900 [Giesbergeria sp.]